MRRAARSRTASSLLTRDMLPHINRHIRQGRTKEGIQEGIQEGTQEYTQERTQGDKLEHSTSFIKQRTKGHSPPCTQEHTR